ncbi:PorV/PorQ family protein [candidate division KSB1 bacterium]|nr:MAG: PorV/PorQ family protein [candidate division KSB1 bacterium]
MKRWPLLVLLAALPFIPQSVWAQAKVGTAGVQFLKISPSCRAVGMGEAFVAVANDASAIYHNPGAIARLEKPEGMFSYIDYVAGLQYGFLGITHPMDKWNGAWAASVVYLTTDEMDETTPERPNGTGRKFTAGDVALGLTYSQKLTDKFSVGGTFKYLNETLADKSASGWAADVGTYYNTGWRSVRIAMFTSNFGPDMNFVDGPFPMPMNFTFGVSAYALNSKDRQWWTGSDSVGTHALLVGLAWSHPNDNVEVYNIGLEYGYQDMAFLRFGKKINGVHRWNWEDYQRKIDDGEDATDRDPFYEYPLFSETGKFFQNGATIGAGLKLHRLGLTIDYAFTGIAFMENTHRFSLGYKFPKSFF